MKKQNHTFKSNDLIKGDQRENIDNWNDRLDENLEPNQTGDLNADERAKEFHKKNQLKKEK